jgi:hypothetical protein
MHMTTGVDAANETLSKLSQSLKSVNDKLDIIAMFRLLDSSLEKDLRKYVMERGGPDACIADDTALAELTSFRLRKDPTSSSVISQGGWRPVRSGTVDESLKALKKELMEDVDVNFAKNMAIFERKLLMQQKQLVKDIEDVVWQSGDRVIHAISAGPHDRLVDPV